MTASPPLSAPRPANHREAPKIPEPASRPRGSGQVPPPDFAREVPALLLCLDPEPLDHRTLGAVRSLGRAGVEVHALLAAPRGPVSRSRYLERVHPWTPATVDPAHEGLRRTLWRIGERLGRPAVLIPMDQVSALSVAGLREALGRRFLVPSVSLPQVLEVADWERLALGCTRLGVPHPETRLVEDGRQAVEVAATLGPPVVAKWARPWLLGAANGPRPTTVLHHPDQAGELYAAGQHLGSPLLLQRYVAPTPGGDRSFHGYFDARSRLLFGGTGPGTRTRPGTSPCATAGEYGDLTETARALAAALGYQGVLDLDFRWDREAGAFLLLDAHARSGAGHRRPAGEGDMDAVRAQHLDLTGRTVPQPGSPREGRPSRTLPPRGRATDGPLREASAEGEPRWFAGDDPGPFAAMAGSLLRRALTSYRGRGRR
ncbi:ATP-grasp domain-containing protein [Streptomyces sp. NPDC005438]|uniref:ATP-grasp domain-containing protein n=1 Tax=Streptomyces sp. NPDC005438 TaxID=3156880 RepID=UPI0033A3C090